MNTPPGEPEQFNRHWWGPGILLGFDDSLERFRVVREGDGTEIARAKIDARRSGLYDGYGVPASLDDFVEIAFIEVAASHRLQGIGTSIVSLLLDKYRGANMMVGSEADGFWESLGWAEYRNLEDPAHYRKLFIHWADTSPHLESFP